MRMFEIQLYLEGQGYEFKLGERGLVGWEWRGATTMNCSTTKESILSAAEHLKKVGD